MKKIFLFFACSFFAFGSIKASVCYDLAHTGNLLRISVLPNTDYAGPPVSIWTTAQVTIAWSATLGSDVITSAVAQNGFPYTADGPAELDGGLYYQRFGFAGISYNFPFSVGPAVEVLQLLVEHPTIPTATFSIVESPPVVGGQASFTNVLEDQFFSGGCNLEVQSVPLPVELLSFQVQKMNESQAKLLWQTVSESNNKGFEIQRSIGLNRWQRIGWVRGNGDSDLQQNYSFIDKDPSRGINFYRLKQVDFDDAYTISEVRHLEFQAEDYSVSVYPNPASKQFNLKVVSEDYNQAEVFVYNLQGDIVMVTPLDIPVGTSVREFDCSQLPVGEYVIHLRSDATHYMASIIIVD